MGVSPNFTSIERHSPADEVRKQLLQAIESGDLKPGMALPSERVLCSTFGVSRVSVREALIALEAMKLIDIRHGRGAFVRDRVEDRYAEPFAEYLRLNREGLIELHKVRGALDVLAAEEASVHASEEGLDSIGQAAEAFKEAVASSAAISTIAERDVEFHLSIAYAAGGDLLPRLLDDLHKLMRESRQATMQHRGQLGLSVSEHQAIADAIRDGDPAAARAAVLVHMTGLREWLEHLPR